MRILAGCIVCAIFWAIGTDMHLQNTERVEAHEPEVVEEPREVRVEVIYNWDKARIEQEIRKVFHEDPDTAVKIAKCESGLVIDIQSNHILDYGREQSFGLMQIHAPAWHHKAVALGYEDYKTDPIDNLAMARYIYDRSGWQPWTCYTKRMI